MPPQRGLAGAAEEGCCPRWRAGPDGGGPIQILKFWDSYESLGVAAKMKPGRENGYQVFESMVDTGKTDVLCPVALHLAEGSTQTVSNPEAEMAGGA